MKDITLAIGIVGVLAVIAMFAVQYAERFNVLSYAVTAIGSLATGNKIGSLRKK